VVAQPLPDHDADLTFLPGACDVLVADDDPAIRAIVTEILELEGYAVETATNGREALAVLEQAQPWLLLLDMRMPILDGWGVAREIAARQLNVKVLVMTATQDAQAWAAEIQADGYLAKPFDLRHLLQAVAQFRPSV
jgi:two-component system chemotaxis response regulator CheY